MKKKEFEFQVKILFKLIKEIHRMSPEMTLSQILKLILEFLEK